MGTKSSLEFMNVPDKIAFFGGLGRLCQEHPQTSASVRERVSNLQLKFHKTNKEAS